MHGRGGAAWSWCGPANRAVLQPKGSANGRLNLLSRESYFCSRYGERLPRRHVESVAGATLLQMAPSY